MSGLPKGRLAGKNPNIHKYQGGWIQWVVQAAIAVGSAVLNKKGSDKANKNVKSARERQADIEEGRLDLAKKQDERSGQLFDRYMEQYAPREEALLSEAFDRPIDPAAEEARATTDVRSSLANARGMSDRNMGRMGVNPNSGRYVGLDRMRGLEEAKIESGARTRARSNVRSLNFGRQAAVVGMGRNLPVTSAGFAAQAGAGYAGAANEAGRNARGAESLAYDAGAGYGQSLGNVAGQIGGAVQDWWGGRNAPKPTSPTLGRGGPAV